MMYSLHRSNKGTRRQKKEHSLHRYADCLENTSIKRNKYVVNHRLKIEDHKQYSQNRQWLPMLDGHDPQF